MTITAAPVTVEHFLTRPAYLLARARHERRTADVCRRGLLGFPSPVDLALARELDQLAGLLTVRAGVELRLESGDRHTRAMAQAEAAGLTGVRDAYTANA